MSTSTLLDRIFAAHLSGTAHGYAATNTPETPPLEELCRAVADTDRWYIEYLEQLAPALREEKPPLTFTDGECGRMSREEMLAHVATHGGYQRGAVERILAQLSVPPPRDIFTVHLHRPEPARREPGQ